MTTMPPKAIVKPPVAPKALGAKTPASVGVTRERPGSREPDTARVQRLAAWHGVWQTTTTGTYDEGRSRAFARLYEPHMTPDIEALLMRDFTVGVGALETAAFPVKLPFVPNFSDRLLAASDEQLSQVGLNLLSVEARLRQNTAHTTTIADLRSPGVLAALPEDVAFSEQTSGGTGVPETLKAGAPALVGNFLNRLTGRSLTWITTGNKLGVGVEVGDSEYFFDVELDGPIGDTSMDAILALTEAVYGTRHRVLRADDLPGQQTNIGRAWEFIGGITDPVFRLKDAIDAPLNWLLDRGAGDDEGNRFRSSNQITEDRTRASMESVSVDLDSDAVVIAAAGQLAQAGFGIPQAADLSRAWYDDLTPEQRAAVEGEMEAETKAQIEQRITALADDRHSVKRALDDTALVVAQAATAWNQFTQSNIVHLADFVTDIGEGVLSIPDQGLAGFTAAFAPDGALPDSASDWVGLSEDNPWRGSLDFAASIAGDPFTWIGVSGPMRAATAQRMLATPEGAVEFLARPHTQPWLASLESAQAAGQNRILVSLLGAQGMTRHGLEEVLAGVPVTQVLRREMTEGLFVPTLTGSLKFHNQAVLIKRLASLGDDADAEYLRGAFSQFSTSRSLSLAPDQAMDDRIAMAMARSTVDPDWIANPQLFDDYVGEVLRLTSPDTRVAKEVIGLQAERQAARRKELLYEAQQAGHRKFLASESKVRATRDTLARVEADIAATTSGAADIGYLDDALSRAELRMLQEGTAETTFEYRAALAARNAADDTAGRLAALESRANLIRTGDEQLTAIQGRITQARLAKDDAGLAAARAEFDALRAQVSEVGSVLPAGFGTAEYAARQTKALEWLERWRVESKELERLRGLRARVRAPGGERVALIESDRKFMDAWARSAGLESEGRMAWEKVAGKRGATEAEGLAESLAMGDSDKVIQLKAILGEGPAGLSGVPVSPMQMVAYQARASDAWYSKVLMPNPVEVKRAIPRLLENIRKAWTANVLFNPYTFLRSNLDEPIRDFYLNGIGAVKRAGRRLEAGFRTVELDDIANAYSYRMTRPWHAPGEAPTFIAPSRTAARYGADTLGLESQVSQAGFNNAARHLFNGVLPSRPVVRAWAAARHSGDSKGFFAWWDDQGGRLLVPGKVAEAGRVVTQTADEVMRGWDTVLDSFAAQVPAANREAFKASVLKAWATGENLSPAVLRQLKVLPSASPSVKGFVNHGYDLMFGRPASTHGSMVFAEFYDQAYGVLASRHSTKLLTAEKLANLADTTVERAAMMLSSADPLVDDLVRNQGFFTERILGVQAKRIARIHADHMAYQMGATSLAGKRLAQAFPFLKAQLDFLGFYAKEVTSGAELGLSSWGQKALRGLGGGRLIERGVPFLGKSVQIPGVPLNLRLASRIADTLGAVSQLPDEETDDLFGRALSNFTFIPTDLEDDLWLQLQPGLAPIPSWLLHMLPVSVDEDAGGLEQFAAATRRFLDAAWPSFSYSPDEAQARDIFDFVVPDSKVSLRRLVERGVEAVTPPGMLGLSDPLNPSQGTFGTPPGFYSLLRERIAAELATNPNLVKGSDEWNDMVRRVTTETYRDSTRKAAFDTAKSVLAVSGFKFDADDGQQLDLYEGFLGDLGLLHQLGYVGDPQVDELTALWADYQSGAIDYQGATRLSDLATDILYGVPDLWTDLLVVRHPELAANLTSQWACTDQAPAGNCRGDRLVVSPGADGRELRELGRKQGWLVRRPPEQLFESAYARHAAAARRLRTQVWTQATGLKSWSSANPASPESRVRVAGFELQALRDLGAYTGDASELVVTRGQLHEMLLPYSYESQIAPFSTPATDAILRPYGVPTEINRVRKAMNESGFDGDDTYTWPEETRAYVRDIYDRAITQGIITQAEYDRELSPLYGDLAYEPPDPPPLAQTDYHFTVDPRDISIIDGDTLAVTFPDGDARVRLVGVNAAEQNTANPAAYQAYLTQTEALRSLIDGASEVSFAVFDTERFLTTQEVANGEVRWLMWLYIDGQPVWDPASFSSTQPTGYRIGGEGL